MAMTPRSGRTRPAIMLISDVLPAPDEPNRPVTRPSLVKATSTEKSPSCLKTSTCSISVAMQSLRRAAREPFREDQGDDGDADRDDHETRSGGIAVRCLDQRIDRRGNRLCLARNVGDESDGG